MVQRILCPGCGKALRIPDGVTDPWLSCPRCLAQLPNPEEAAGDGIESAPSPRAPQRSARRTVRDFVKRTSTAFANAAFSAAEAASPDANVRRDQQGTSVLLIVLAGHGGLGVGCGTLFSVTALRKGAAWPLAIFLALVLGIGAFTAVRVYNRPWPPTGAQGVGRVVVKTLAGIGCLVLAPIVAIAAFIVLLAVCLV